VKWIRNNWQWAALNGVALIVMLSLLLQIDDADAVNSNFDPLLESGKWAIRFLLFSLLMTPLNTMFGWRTAIKLRKPAGLWAFGFGVFHFAYYVVELGADWLDYPIPDYIAALGVIGLIILTALAATSTRWAMKRMGKGWKRLHRLVYAAGIIILVHALLEASGNKRIFATNPLAIYEIQLYMAALVILLAARIPVVRATLANLRHRPRMVGGKSG
jgi:sulfoxide reductase heme-binding subunit YedZ